jgi:hypothetical protein
MSFYFTFKNLDITEPINFANYNNAIVLEAKDDITDDNKPLNASTINANNIKLYKQLFDSITDSFKDVAVDLNYLNQNDINVIYDRSTGTDSTVENYQIKIFNVSLEENATYKLEFNNIAAADDSSNVINHHVLTYIIPSNTTNIQITLPAYFNVTTYNQIHEIKINDYVLTTDQYTIKENTIYFNGVLFANDVFTIVVNKSEYLTFTTAVITTSVPKVFSTYINNTFHKLNNLHKILDIDTLLYEPDYFSFQYTTTVSNNTVSNNVVNPNTTDYLLQFDNDNLFETEFVKSHLPEFISYFESISNEANIEFEILSLAEDLRTTKNLMMKKSVLINQYKGSYSGIKNILDIFRNSLGYQIVNVTQDPYRNFSYYVVSDIPVEYWNIDIKPIVHPLGWIANYEQIYTYETFNNVDYPNLNWIDFQRRKFASQYYECTMFLTKSVDIALVATPIPSLSNKEWTHEIPIGDFITGNKFNFNFTLYDMETTSSISGVPVTGISYDFDNVANYKLKTLPSTKRLLTFESSAGLSETYEWYFYDSTVSLVDPINIKVTYKNHTKIDDSAIDTVKVKFKSFDGIDNLTDNWTYTTTTIPLSGVTQIVLS